MAKITGKWALKDGKLVKGVSNTAKYRKFQKGRKKTQRFVAPAKAKGMGRLI